MKDKLPVVGQRYKDKSGLVFKLKGHSSIHLDHPDWWMEFCFEEMKISCPLKYFFEQFEELPDSNPQEEPQDEIDKMYQLEVDIIRLESDLNIKKAMLRIMERNRVNKTPNPVDLEKGEVSEVDRALEADKRINLPKEPNWVGVDLAKRQSWSNMSKPEPKIDIKEERVEPVSIWKDVGELPRVCGTVLIKWRNLTGVEMAYFYAGDESFYTDSNCNNEDEFVKQNIEKCCLLTDFINSFEQMQKDFEELKRRR